MLNDDQVAALVSAARNAAQSAYAPYSGFAVGAALQMSDGMIITGANFENASYGLSLCAETVAVATANSAGRLQDIVAIAVAGGRLANGAVASNTPVYPCGRCCQILTEASHVCGRDLPIYSASVEGDTIDLLLLSQLLPHAFGPANLSH